MPSRSFDPRRLFPREGTWRPTEEMLSVMGKVRDRFRDRFERSKFAEMSISDALALVKEEGMYVTNLYEDREGMWRIFTRYSKNGRLAGSGFGEDIQEAIWHMFDTFARQGRPNEDLDAPQKSHETPAGEMDEESLSRYCAPAAAQWPADLDPSPVEESDVSADDFGEIEDDEDDLIGDLSQVK